jgi:hypothetical protein
VFLIECAKSVDSVKGCFVEAGCASGATTVFLNKFMDAENMERDYFAIDTFSGFVRDHLEHEIKDRAKQESLRGHFTENKKSWFDRSMRLHGVERVKSIQSDVTELDFSALSPIAFCLIDVDLYKPIHNILPKVYAAMAPGGVIIVDDCAPNTPWDGALQAYEEFVRSKGLPMQISAGKLGIIRMDDLAASGHN